MTGHRVITGATAVALLAALAVAPPALGAGDPAPCRVRNGTQGTHGTSFGAMVRAAHDGDELRVSGTCPAVGVTVRVDLAVTGTGERRAVLRGRGPGSVLRVARGAVVLLRHVAIIRGAPGIANDGRLTLIDAAVRDNEEGIRNHGTLRLVDSVVQDNRGSRGAGINSSTVGNTAGRVILVDSVVRRNQATYPEADWYASGAGIWMHSGDLVLIRSAVYDNRVDGTGSGGIAGDDRPRYVLIDSVVRDNRGDGVAGDGVRLTMTDSVVRGNSGTGVFGYCAGSVSLVRSRVLANRGGGISAACGTNVHLTDSVVQRNTKRGADHFGPRRGAGMGRPAGSLIATDSTIARNRASVAGGGIAGWGPVILIDTRVTGNTAGKWGGGISVGRGGATLTSSTVTGNAAGEQGGGIWVRGGGSVSLDATSAVTGNTPDDCVGTPAC